MPIRCQNKHNSRIPEFDWKTSTNSSTKIIYLPIHQQYKRLHEVSPEPRRQPARVGVEQTPNLVGQISEVIRVERRDVGEEQGEVPELLGHLPATSRGRGCGQRRLLLEEEHRGLEVAVELAELLLVALRVALHLRLQHGEVMRLASPAWRGSGGRLRRERRRVLARHRRWKKTSLVCAAAGVLKP